MFKDDPALGGVLLVLGLMAIVGCMYVAEIAYKHYTTVSETVNTVVDTHAEELKAGTISLCEQYRRWQALPEIEGATTSMDTICEKLGR